MAAVSESIAREYFELHGLLVRQHRKFFVPTKRENEDIDFFILNPRVQPRRGERPFVLSGRDLAGIHKAVVVVKGWHTETFSHALLANAPEIFRFVEPTTFQQAAQAFGDERDILKLLVVPALPQEPEARTQSIALLREKGIDGVIPFRTMLAELLEGVRVNRNYQKSDVLQLLRILKNYEFIREPQMELFGERRKGKHS
jgi:hypothetical protein